ncbi:DUF1877 family protein [Saccharospirillum sp. HFRX-1]|uniref:DUF1877 family protein n=1 Tax=unclassified Saccharospirillum TaxID=2633430 RepID=UPI0037202558
MSIIANYARIKEADFEKFALDQEKLFSESAEFIDIDRSWDPLSWILSERKRAEHAYNQLVMHSIMSERNQGKTKKPTLLKRIFKKDPEEESFRFLKQEQQKLDEFQPEVILVGIEGRGSNKEPRIDFGYGESCIFKSEELASIAASFNECTRLERKPDFEKMDSEDVFPSHWREEGDDIFENYIVANFNKLKQFYNNAHRENQIVIMWYS